MRHEINDNARQQCQQICGDQHCLTLRYATAHTCYVTVSDNVKASEAAVLLGSRLDLTTGVAEMHVLYFTYSKLAPHVLVPDNSEKNMRAPLPDYPFNHHHSYRVSSNLRIQQCHGSWSYSAWVYPEPAAKPAIPSIHLAVHPSTEIFFKITTAFLSGTIVQIHIQYCDDFFDLVCRFRGSSAHRSCKIHRNVMSTATSIDLYQTENRLYAHLLRQTRMIAAGPSASWFLCYQTFPSTLKGADSLTG